MINPGLGCAWRGPAPSSGSLKTRTAEDKEFQMAVRAFSVGILVFGTSVAVLCKLVIRDIYFTTLMLNVQPFVIGIIVALVSLLYFNFFVVQGNFFRFTFEYWLAGSICYLLVLMSVVGFDLYRKDRLSTIDGLISDFADFVLPSAVVLIQIGVGTAIVSYFVSKYSSTRE